MISLSYFSLTFITFASVFADVLPFLQSKSYQDGTWGLYPAQTFLSDRYVVAPVPNVLTNARSDVSPENYITWAPHGSGIPVTGPQLLDADTLSVVYQAPTFAEDNFGLSVQTCNNTDYLVWWAGTNIEGRAAGQYYIVGSFRRAISGCGSDKRFTVQHRLRERLERYIHWLEIRRCP